MLMSKDTFFFFFCDSSVKGQRTDSHPDIKNVTWQCDL